MRFGQSRTVLADGTVVRIGGEHEDHYDPDFFIYNDVIVDRPSGETRIYEYPLDVFPPTDSHSATVVGDRIVVVGTIGYPADRVAGSTPVHVLDTATFAIERARTDGDAPGWIHKHEAALSEDGRSIIVRRGLVIGDAGCFRENMDDWALDVARWRWTRLTDRRWQQWEIGRADRKSSRLFWVWCMRQHAGKDRAYDRDQLAELRRKHGEPPDFAIFDARYRPPVPHVVSEAKAEEDSDRISRVVVDGVTVRYVEEVESTRVIVEGALAEEIVLAVVEDARAKREAIEAAPCEARRL
jgi:hypothetical protein